MADKTVEQGRRLKGKADGSFAEVIATDAGLEQVAPDFGSVADVAAFFGGFGSLAPNDFLARKVTANGQVIMCLSGSPLDENTESVITSSKGAGTPCALEIESSMSQRIRHQFASLGLVTPDDTITQPADIQINTIYQSSATDGAAYNAVAGTVLTVVLNTPVPDGFFVSDWADSYGLKDNRLNYPNLCIRWISQDRKTVVAGFSDEAALPSIAATYSPAAGTAFLRLRRDFGSVSDMIGMRFDQTTATSAALLSMFAGSDMQSSGTIQGDQRATIGTTAPIYNVAANGQVELRATTRYRLEVGPREIWFGDRASDTNATYSSRGIRTAVKPHGNRLLKAQFCLTNPRSMTRPVARIKTISKAGSTTWNIQTTEAHGLATGNYVTIKGVRDQVNFANLATPVAVTVVDATNFTLTGTTGTANSNGGSVILANGGIDQQGLITQAIQSAVWDGTANTLTLVGSAAWSTGVGIMNVSDYMHIHGAVDGSGNLLGIDGPWEVFSISGTSLVLVPITDALGARRSPAISALNLTNCGGSLLHRTTLRNHDLNFEGWSEQVVRVDGQGTIRPEKAVPANVINNVAIGTLPALPPGTNLAGDFGAQMRATAGGIASTARLVSSAASTNATVAKASAGRIAKIEGYNASASVKYLKLYNKATAPTVGTDTPVRTIALAPSAPFEKNWADIGYYFSAGISYAITGGAADNDATAVAAADVVGLNIDYI